MENTVENAFAWTKLEFLSHLGKKKVLKVAAKLGVARLILENLSLAVIQEILSYTESLDGLLQGSLTGFGHALRLENYFISQGQGFDIKWKEVQERYGFDPMRPYFALQKVLRLQMEQIQIENRIEKLSPEIDQKLDELKTILKDFQESGNTRKLINPQLVHNAQHLYNILNHNMQTVIDMISYYKYSKRFENQREQQEQNWPTCSKFQQWLNALLRQSLDFGKYLWQCKVDLITLANLPENLLATQILTAVDTLLLTAVDMVSTFLNATSLLELDAKTGFVKYPSSIRVQFQHLLGNQLTQLIPLGSKAKLSLLNAEDVKYLLNNPRRHLYRGCVGSLPSAELKNNVEEILQHEDGHYVVNFSKCEVVRPNRIVKPSHRKKLNHLETVMDEKYCFLCEFVIQLFPDLWITVWGLSDNPVIVAANASRQEVRSLASLFFDKALRSINRVDLDVPRKANCSQIVDAMEEEQIALIKVGFSEETKSYLMTRLQGNDPIGEITLERFCEENIPGTNMTLWTWFLKALRLGESHFLNMWTEGYVEGFLGRTWAQRVLSIRPPGTCIIHFSEEVVSAFEISWIHSDYQVYSIGPFTNFFLTWKKLEETIADLARTVGLQYIYPNQELGIFFAHHTAQTDSEDSIQFNSAQCLYQLQFLSLPVYGQNRLKQT